MHQHAKLHAAVVLFADGTFIRTVEDVIHDLYDAVRHLTLVYGLMEGIARWFAVTAATAIAVPHERAVFIADFFQLFCQMLRICNSYHQFFLPLGFPRF